MLGGSPTLVSNSVSQPRFVPSNYQCVKGWCYQHLTTSKHGQVCASQRSFQVSSAITMNLIKCSKLKATAASKHRKDSWGKHVPTV